VISLKDSFKDHQGQCITFKKSTLLDFLDPKQFPIPIDVATLKNNSTTLFGAMVEEPLHQLVHVLTMFPFCVSRLLPNVKI
jgi:hypothetical protein